MPRTATITAPDGRTATLTIPDGATDAQIQAAAGRAKSALTQSGSVAPDVAPDAASAPAPAAAPAPAQPPPGESIQPTPTRGVIRGMLPEGGPLGFLADVVTNPTEVAGTIGTGLGTEAGLAAGALFAPETLGASLILPALGAGLGGFLGREAGASVEGPHGALVAPGQGRTRSTLERWIGLATDALPVTIGAILRPMVLTTPEVQGAVDALTAGKALGKRGAERLPAGAEALAAERAAAVPKPAAAALPPKAGPAPKPPGTVPTPEAAPGVPTGALSPLPAPVAPTVGPEFTRVAQESLRATEHDAAARYSSALAEAQSLNLEGPPPSHIIRAASDALDALDRSGLDPQTRDGARRVLESIRDLDVGRLGAGTTVGPGGVIEGAVTKEPLPDTVSYADLDAWRQKLQEYAPAFSKLGQAQSFAKGSVGHVLGLVKDEMATMARGTAVEGLQRSADEFFIHEVQPARSLARSVLKGEIEPNAFVDTLTSKANQSKFSRYITQLDARAPGQARAFRRVKYQNMIDRATNADGGFNPTTFLSELDKMPARTRVALLRTTEPNEITELLSNIDTAKGYARTAQADAQAAADSAHADALAAHATAVADYTKAVAQSRTNVAAYKTAREHALAQDPVLTNARRKLASQKMLIEAPADVLGGVAAMKSALSGNLSPFFAWLGGAAVTSKGLSVLLATPKAVPIVNRLFRLSAAGASPNVLARQSTQLVAHLTEGAGRELLDRGTP